MQINEFAVWSSKGKLFHWEYICTDLNCFTRANTIIQARHHIICFISGHLCQNDEIISSCNGENLQIDCGGSGKIAIQRVFFGAKSSEDALYCQSEDTRKDPSCCQRGYDDCIFYNRNTESVFKRVCSGRRSCLYRVQETKGRQCRSSDYMTVYYQCIPGKKTSSVTELMVHVY